MFRRFLPIAVATFYIRPDADDTDGGWTDQSGGSTLYSVIDESSPNDADYIMSSPNPVNDVCKIRLENPSVSPAQPFSVRYRYRKSTPSGTLELRVRLLQGNTEIASWTESDIGSSYVTTERTLTTPEFEAITNFDDLYIELRANHS